MQDNMDPQHFADYLISFDDELLAIFFEAYKSPENGHKRELILALKDFIYNDKSVTSDKDLQVTIDNIKKAGIDDSGVAGF